MAMDSLGLNRYKQMKLTDNIETHFRIDANQKKALTRLHLVSIRDLLYHFPSRYTDISEVRPVSSATAGETITIVGTLSKLKTKKKFPHQDSNGTSNTH